MLKLKPLAATFVPGVCREADCVVGKGGGREGEREA